MHTIINHTLSGNDWNKVDLGTIKQIYGLKLQLRTAADVQVAYQNNATAYYTVKSGAVLEENFGASRPLPDLYVKGTGGTVVEILVKTGL